MNKTTLIWLIIIMSFSMLYSQDSAPYSRLLDLTLPEYFLKEENSFAIFAGQTVLEMETEFQQITIKEVEIFSWKNSSHNPIIYT